jgi:hypothetical protein
MTSVVSLRLVAVPSSLLELSFKTYFDPPDNIRGKLCYVEYSLFALKQQAGPSITSRDAFMVNSSWTTPFSHTNVNGRPGRAYQAMIHSNSPRTKLGAALCDIPGGSHQVTFDIARLDGGQITSNTTSNVYLLLGLKITPATFSQPPIGV